MAGPIGRWRQSGLPRRERHGCLAQRLLISDDAHLLPHQRLQLRPVRRWRLSRPGLREGDRRWRPIDRAAPVFFFQRSFDDAAGEAFDKVATILGLPYPGGPAIDKLARRGDPLSVKFPRTMLGKDSLDFSFSGIKTAVLYYVHGHGKTSGGLEKMSESQLADTAAAFQAAVIDVLIRKAMLAVKQTGLSTVVLGGGVAANKTLRSALEAECQRRALRFFAAKPAYCTDNGAMIAALGYHLLEAGEIADLTLDAYPSN